MTALHQPQEVSVTEATQRGVTGLVADLHDLALVLTRAATDTGSRTSIDDAMAAFGHSQESLAHRSDDDHE